MKLNRCPRWEEMVWSQMRCRQRWPDGLLVMSLFRPRQIQQLDGEYTRRLRIFSLREKSLPIQSHDLRRAIPSLMVEVKDVIKVENDPFESRSLSLKTPTRASQTRHVVFSLKDSRLLMRRYSRLTHSVSFQVSWNT